MCESNWTGNIAFDMATLETRVLEGRVWMCKSSCDCFYETYFIAEWSIFSNSVPSGCVSDFGHSATVTFASFRWFNFKNIRSSIERQNDREAVEFESHHRSSDGSKKPFVGKTTHHTHLTMNIEWLGKKKKKLVNVFPWCIAEGRKLTQFSWVRSWRHQFGRWDWIPYDGARSRIGKRKRLLNVLFEYLFT